MKERVENSFIFSTHAYADKDKSVSLFTKRLGKVRARVMSGRKTTSRLSPHLDPMTLSTVRVVEKHRFTVVDAFVKKRFNDLRKDLDRFRSAYNLIYLLDSVLPEGVPDVELWYNLYEYLEKATPNINRFLNILGYDPALARCISCNESDVKMFLIPDQSFLCGLCCAKVPNHLTSEIVY